MTQFIESKLQEGINYEFLNQLRLEKNLTLEDVEAGTKISKDTIKNVLTGKTKNPGVGTLNPICKFLGVPIERVLMLSPKEAIEYEAIKKNDVSILSLKEIYEFQIAQINENNEKHISEIRTHYEQHFNDLSINYEHRLSDKREIIQLYKEELDSEKKSNYRKTIAIIIFALILGALFVLELTHPEHGWIKFGK